MSWGEVFKINSNMKKPINEQLRDMKYQAVRIITTTTTYKPEKTGMYKIICVGKGGDGGYESVSNASFYGLSGGGGGVAIKTMRLSSSTNYSVTVGTTASFAAGSTTITAIAGSPSTSVSSGTVGAGGTASGGDYNFSGTTGRRIAAEFNAPVGGSVGVWIDGLSNTPAPHVGTLIEASGASPLVYCIGYAYGDSILNYGGGGTGAGFYTSSTYRGGYSTAGKPAAVIIIPLEMEE